MYVDDETIKFLAERTKNALNDEKEVSGLGSYESGYLQGKIDLINWLVEEDEINANAIGADDRDLVLRDESYI